MNRGFPELTESPEIPESPEKQVRHYTRHTGGSPCKSRGIHTCQGNIFTELANTMAYGEGCYITLFSPSRHLKRYPVTSLCFTELKGLREGLKSTSSNRQTQTDIHFIDRKEKALQTYLIYDICIYVHVYTKLLIC